MRIDLSGTRAVVSGSSAGIGYAIAAGLAGAGATVVVNGRSAERTEAAVARLRGEVGHAEIVGVAADLSTADGVARFVEREPKADIVVNNLGIYEMKPFFEIPDADWQHVFDVNVMSGVRLSRHYAPAMVEKGWGRIVFISSESGLNIPPEMVHYGFTKTAQLAVSRGLAETLSGTGVTVNSVLPGPTMSEGVGAFVADIARERGLSTEEAGACFVKQFRPTSLIGRVATPEEVANMVVYVCSRQASATSGAALRVEGGIIRSLG